MSVGRFFLVFVYVFFYSKYLLKAKWIAYSDSELKLVGSCQQPITVVSICVHSKFSGAVFRIYGSRPFEFFGIKFLRLFF